MPLAFESLSHGTIAFGFFNIESDMLLMDQYFFFVDDFCSNVEKIATAPFDQAYEEIWAAAGTPHAVFRLTPLALEQITRGRWLQIT